MSGVYTTMKEPTKGHWYRVTQGHQRGAEGVCDLICGYTVGTRYRISNRDGVVGRFAAEQLQEIPNPQAAYVSQVSQETRQRAFDLLTGGKVKA
jgi:hypothetical protein